MFSFDIGVDAAHQVGLQYQEEQEDLNSFIDDQPPQLSSSPVNEEVLMSFMNSGFYYSHETDAHWILILSRFLNTKISVKDIFEEGVTVSFEAVLPTVSFLETVLPKTGIHANMFNFSSMKYDLFISSPKPLDIDPRRILNDDSDPHWLLLVVPFSTESTSHVLLASDVIEPANK